MALFGFGKKNEAIKATGMENGMKNGMEKICPLPWGAFFSQGSAP